MHLSKLTPFLPSSSLPSPPLPFPSLLFPSLPFPSLSLPSLTWFSSLASAAPSSSFLIFLIYSATISFCLSISSFCNRHIEVRLRKEGRNTGQHTHIHTHTTSPCPAAWQSTFPAPFSASLVPPSPCQVLPRAAWCSHAPSPFSA